MKQWKAVAGWPFLAARPQLATEGQQRRLVPLFLGALCCPALDSVEAVKVKEDQSAALCVLQHTLPLTHMADQDATLLH